MRAGRRQWGRSARLPWPRRAALRPPPPGSPPRSPGAGGRRASLGPGTPRSAVRAPCRAPGLQDELEAGCATTLRPGTRRPGAGSAGQVTFPGPGWGLGEGRWQPYPDSCPPAQSRAGAGIRGGCGASERERNFGVTSPNRLLPRGGHGHHVARLLSPSPATPSPRLPPLPMPGTPSSWFPSWPSQAHCRAGKDF